MFNLDVEMVFVSAWERWKSAIGDIILYSFLYMLGVIVIVVPLIVVLMLAIGTSTFLSVISQRSFEEFARNSLIGLILGLTLLIFAVTVILPGWAAGYLYIFRNILLSQRLTFSDMFSQFSKILHIILLSIVVGFIVLFGLLLFIIPGLVFAILYSQALFLIIDKNMDFTTAMGTSWKRVKKDFWSVTGILVLLIIAQLGLSMILAVLSIIGSLAQVLLVTPYFILASWVLYFALFPSDEQSALATAKGNVVSETTYHFEPEQQSTIPATEPLPIPETEEEATESEAKQEDTSQRGNNSTT